MTISRSHCLEKATGACVGALIEGIPPGTPIDEDELNHAIANRRPGRKGMSARSETDQCELLSGVCMREKPLDGPF